MEKLNNWSDWCNDKVILHDKDSKKILLINVNTIMHILDTDDGTEVDCTENCSFCVEESIEDILGMISEMVQESEARKAAAAKAEEEARKAQYEAYAKAAADGKATA